MGELPAVRLTTVQDGLELVGALAPTLMEAHFLMRFAIGDGPVQDPSSVFGLAPSRIFEGQHRRHERLLRRLPRFHVGIRDDDALILYDFEVYARIRKLVPVGIAHHDER